MSELIRFRLEMSEEDLELERQSADDGLIIESVKPMETSTTGRLEEGRFVSAVVIIAAATLAVIVKRAFEHWLKSKEEGIQIDTRTDPPTISMIANVPRGFVLIIDKDGRAQPHKVDYERGDELSPLMSLALKKT